MLWGSCHNMIVKGIDMREAGVGLALKDGRNVGTHIGQYAISVAPKVYITQQIYPSLLSRPEGSCCRHLRSMGLRTGLASVARLALSTGASVGGGSSTRDGVIGSARHFRALPKIESVSKKVKRG